MSQVRVLVGDPLELVAEGLRCWMQDAPDVLIVGHASTGKLVLDRLEDSGVDLVLLEVSLPDMDGIDTARAIRKKFPNVRILAHSALTDIEYVNSMLIEGAGGYLVKGAPKEEYIIAIRSVMSGADHVSLAAQASIANGYRYTSKHPDGEYIGLTQREREVIRLVAMERTNEEIGALLNMSAETVKTHRKRIMGKLNVRSAAGLVKYAVDRHWI